MRTGGLRWGLRRLRVSQSGLREVRVGASLRGGRCRPLPKAKRVPGRAERNCRRAHCLHWSGRGPGSLPQLASEPAWLALLSRPKGPEALSRLRALPPPRPPRCRCLCCCAPRSSTGRARAKGAGDSRSPGDYFLFKLSQRLELVQQGPAFPPGVGPARGQGSHLLLSSPSPQVGELLGGVGQLGGSGGCKNPGQHSAVLPAQPLPHVLQTQSQTGLWATVSVQ